MGGVEVGILAYSGTEPVGSDLIGGHIGLGIVDPPPSQAAIRDGRIKGIAISSKRRAAFFPDIPTFDEQGLKDYEVGGWFGLVGPAGGSPEVFPQPKAGVVTTRAESEDVQR